MNTNIKALSIEEQENVSGGIKAKTVKKIIAGAAGSVALVSMGVILFVGSYLWKRDIDNLLS